MKNKSKKFFIMFIIALFMISFLGGCQSSSSSSTVKKQTSVNKKATKTPGEITVWVCSKDENVINDQINLFKKKYPYISVKVVAMTSKDISDKYIDSCTNGKKLPDIIEVTDDSTATLINGFSDKLLNVASDQDIKKGMFLNNRINNLSRKNSVYGYPWYVKPVFMLYRSDILRSAGIDAEDIKTWDDYVSVGNNLKSSGRKLTSIPNLSEIYNVQLNQLGTDFFDEQGKIDVNGKKVMVANKFIYNILKNQINIDVSNSDYLQLFEKGSIVSLIATPETVLYLEKSHSNLSGKIEITRLPAFENGGNDTAYVDGTNFMISGSSKNKDYAVKFVKFVTGDVDAVYNQFNIYGLCSSNTAAYTYEKIHKKNKYVGDIDMYKWYINSAKLFSNIIYNENYNEVRDEVLRSLNDNIKSNKKIEDIMNDLQKSIEPKYK
ncbi:sugar ABC transporter substrate-binding protein [Clostridium guangxiense]|uniref:sugar ABC transporter substrate-binding protein n=2 Tax=Clostridium TaxID=1485 RepID=UPI001E5A314C|nr:ABC transporter substrate-binding protein [Clostridium guangxiense]MCD2346676.1 ABC transporter substrate-binding protein [Clostridium guangxiense]